MDATPWDGARVRDALQPWAVERRDQLADAARDGDWETVFQILDDDPALINSTRLEGRSQYTPLHQAAWHGALTETVERLLAYGAWRTLRTSAGKRPIDISEERGHQHLARVLRPVVKHSVPQDVLAILQRNVYELIAGYDTNAHQMRHMPELEVLTELDRPAYWFRVTGGGFLIVLRGFELVVDAVSPMDYDSGARYRVTADGIFFSSGEPWTPTA
ncbi:MULTISPECIES: ankyrin repeat domain-containing protein [Streptomyces]|uniref:Ankyrin repeat domain-containing protein n=2 Tax=Streptomyces TaxID=1883 RepID=A0ABV9J6H3_9ACTN